jgi:hypothetical protein
MIDNSHKCNTCKLNDGKCKYSSKKDTIVLCSSYKN